MAARRSASSADGAMRMLSCALCGFEWQTSRIKCPACGEEDPKKLPVFSAQERLGARIGRQRRRACAGDELDDRQRRRDRACKIG